MDKIREYIEYKKTKSLNKKPRYATRKLSIGLVSCMIGFLIFANAPIAHAEDQLGGVEPTSSLAETAPEETSTDEIAPATEEDVLPEETPATETDLDKTDQELKSVKEEVKKKLEDAANISKEDKVLLEEKIDKALSVEEVRNIEKEITEKEKAAPVLTRSKREANDAGLVNYSAAEAEEAESVADAKNSIHGYVGVQTQGDVNLPLEGKANEEYKPIQGVKVYFQWLEDGGRVSPTYYATSGADGRFHILAKPYLSADGDLVKFDSDPTVSGGHEKYRLWVDKTTIPEGYGLHYVTGEQVVFPKSSLTVTAAGSSQSTTKNTFNNLKVYLRKLPGDLMHRDDATETETRVTGKNEGGTVEGRVGWDYSSGAGGIQWKMINQIDSPAPEVVVRASYLSDFAMKQIYSEDTKKRMALDSVDDIRSNKWTPALEDQLQTWIQGKVKKDPENWIAETVTAKTNAEGKYVIQFKGTWGYNPNKDSLDPKPGNKWTKEQIDRLGTVANSASEGNFNGAPTIANNKADTKHINWEWLYVSVDDTDDLRVATPFNYNYYTGSNDRWGFHNGWNNNNLALDTTVGDGVINPQESTFRADFTLAPAEINFHITNYDSVNNLAYVGDVAETSTTGLPYSSTSDQYRIVWYDAKGNQVKEGSIVRPNATGSLESVPFDTKDVTETTEFTAKLYRVNDKGQNDQLLGIDSFTVDVKSYIGSLYDDFHMDNTSKVNGATYTAEGLPKNLVIDQATGNISGKPIEQGAFTVKTAVSVNDKDAGEIKGERSHKYLITDSPLTDGSVNALYNETVKPAETEGYVFKNVSAKFIQGKEIQGLNITGDKITGTPTNEVKATQEDPNVEVTYDIYKIVDGKETLIKKAHVDKVPLIITAAKNNGEYEPNYEDKTVEKGQSITTTPTFTKGGKPTESAPVKSYELGENAPKKATINEKTGEVTYTPTDDTQVGEVNIPVKVTYNDGSVDNTNIKVTVEEKPEAPKTTVEGNPTAVDPKGGEQETGLTVKNKDDKTPTTVTATDEDGQNVPAVIGEDGKIKVTPPANVDGPITVTVKDGDFDSDKVYEVPVTGHTKGKDDNGTEVKPEEPKTTVEGNPTAVNPKGGEQETGLTVKNKDDKTPTTVTAKDEDGNTVDAKIGEDGKIKVTPPANVDGPITVTVKDGDFDSDKVYEVPVTGHTKDKDDNGSEVTPSTLTDADVITPTLPTDKTPVADKTKLTDKEKSEVKDKIEKSNKDKFPEGTKVEVGNDGSATITYPDGSQDTIPGSDLVVEKTPEAPKTQADETNPTVPSKTEVANKDDLTQEEKDKVKKAIEDANKDKFPEGTKVEVGNDGSATITYPDGSQDIIPGSDLVVEKTPEAQSQADQITPNIPDNRTLVADKDKLTDKEKETVKTRLEKANKDNFPQGTKVEVGNDGSATITYPDGSKDTIPGSKLVVEENKATVKKVVDKKSNSPKTGVTGLAGVAGTLAAATAALFGTRKKKEDQE